jgi:hypothetical protein
MRRRQQPCIGLKNTLALTAHMVCVHKHTCVVIHWQPHTPDLSFATPPAVDDSSKGVIKCRKPQSNVGSSPPAAPMPCLAPRHRLKRPKRSEWPLPRLCLNTHNLCQHRRGTPCNQTPHTYVAALPPCPAGTHHSLSTLLTTTSQPTTVSPPSSQPRLSPPHSPHQHNQAHKQAPSPGRLPDQQRTALQMPQQDNSTPAAGSCHMSASAAVCQTPH